jgi:hypothetical protein
METTAQKRRWPNKLREKANIKGKLMEAYSSEFKELMDTLRDVDDKVREEAADLKDVLKVAQTNLNRREFMTAASYLGRFHEKMEAIYQELSRLGNSVDIKHHDFLFGGLDPEHLEYLTTKMGPKMDKYKMLMELGKKASIEKEAGITDWWHNITTDRGKTLSAWEKRFPKYARELRNQTANLLNKSIAFNDLLKSSLKVMAAYRATRKLEDYLKLANKLKERFKSYHLAFMQYYNTQVKRFVEYQKSLQNIGPLGAPGEAVPRPSGVPDWAVAGPKAAPPGPPRPPIGVPAQPKPNPPVETSHTPGKANEPAPAPVPQEKTVPQPELIFDEPKDKKGKKSSTIQERLQIFSSLAAG